MSKAKETYTLFTTSGCLSIEALEKSVSSTLSAEEQKLVDKHVFGCELCRDALDGISSMAEPTNINTLVDELNENLSDGLFDSKEKGPLRKVWSNKRAFYFAAAASILLLTGIFSYLQFRLKDTDSKISVLTEKPSEETFKTQNPIVKETEIMNTDGSSEKNNKALKKETKIKQDPNPGQRETIQIVEDEIELDEDSENQSLDTDIASSPPAVIEPSESIEVEEKIELVKADEVVEKDVEGMAMTMKATGSKKSNRQEKSRQEEGDYIGLDEFAFDDTVEDEQQIFTVVETMPSFPGGEEEMNKFIDNNIKYPQLARENGIQGRVFATFVVERDGKITNIKILRGIGGGCDEEAIRVIKKMPKWIPGKQRGKAVRVQFNFPLLFEMN